jgi:hypothetical protein
VPAEREGGDGAIHAPRLLTVTLALAAATVLVVAPLARADGDPASDYLIGQQVFFPYDTKFPATQQIQFTQLVQEANKAGFKIRVALIASNYDMGSVTSLYLKPRTYARFLGEELSFVFKQRLLVVMSNGFGFNWPHHSSAAAYRTLGKIQISPGADGLLTAAQTAVQRLAAADGVKLTTPTHVTTPARRNSHDRLIIIAGAAALIPLAAATQFALRRRRRKPR